jgi:hypothetical protein
MSKERNPDLKKTYDTIYYLVCLGPTLRCGVCGGLSTSLGLAKRDC